jgi:hypothetical protein
MHLCGASDGVNDPDGEEFADDAAAVDHLVTAVRQMLAGGVSAIANCDTLVFELRDGGEQVIATVPLTHRLGSAGVWQNPAPGSEPLPRRNRVWA